jgi:hypothetical protein
VLEGYGKNAETILEERLSPYDGWLTYMIWSIIALALLIVIVLLVVTKFSGIYEIFPVPQTVAATP